MRKYTSEVVMLIIDKSWIIYNPIKLKIPNFRNINY